MVFALFQKSFLFYINFNYGKHRKCGLIPVYDERILFENSLPKRIVTLMFHANLLKYKPHERLYYHAKVQLLFYCLLCTARVTLK